MLSWTNWITADIHTWPVRRSAQVKLFLRIFFRTWLITIGVLYTALIGLLAGYWIGMALGF